MLLFSFGGSDCPGASAALPSTRRGGHKESPNLYAFAANELRLSAKNTRGEITARLGPIARVATHRRGKLLGAELEHDRQVHGRGLAVEFGGLIFPLLQGLQCGV